MDKLQQVKSILINLSKGIGIILCSYYIIKYNDYTVGWNFNVWLLSSYMSTLNSILATFGTYILVIPLSMLITSFLIENKYLNISCAIFSISGGIVSLMIGAAKGTLQEFSNFRLFVIYHTLTLEEKRIIFIQEFKIAMVELTEESVKKLEYLQSRLSDTYMAVYDNALVKLPAQDVKTYAINTVNDLLLKYESKQPGILKRILYPIGNFIYNHPQEITVGIVIIASVFGCYQAYYYFFGATGVAKATVENLQGTAELGKEATILGVGVAKTNIELVGVMQGAATDVITPLIAKVTNLEQTINTLICVVKRQQEAINNLDYSFNSLVSTLRSSRLFHTVVNAS